MGAADPWKYLHVCTCIYMTSVHILYHVCVCRELNWVKPVYIRSYTHIVSVCMCGVNELRVSHVEPKRMATKALHAPLFAAAHG